MQYRDEAAKLLDEVVDRLRRLDLLSAGCGTHRLDTLEPLATRLEAIARDLKQEARLKPAIAKTSELVTRLIGGLGLENPAYRSLLAGLR